MDANKFMREYKRMCASYSNCQNCPMREDNNGQCTEVPSRLSEEFIYKVTKVIEEWNKESPCKTRQDAFLEQWPNAKVFIDGVLDFCPLELDECYPCPSTDIKMRCQSCRREFWMQEVE